MRYSIRFLSIIAFASPFLEANNAIDFNRDVRPIISDKCFHCHGPDADNQKSEFRLDTREHATADLGGTFGIVPGDLEESDLHWRIWEDFEEDVMPPIDSKLSLTDSEKKILDQWIEEGAPYDEHWSFKQIEKPTVPSLPSKIAQRVSNEIDSFIVARLEQEGLGLSSIASKETLIRRVTLDLTGLPPSIGEIDDFLADESPLAWERVVDRLLASPQYGERMALVWLDAARYADSGGYQNDVRRSQWPWRDWVVDAYNANMPFDTFTIQQLAGDLLERPTSDQLLATAFNRNHRINNEGGIIPEEYLVEYVADRVETTSTVWLGLTMGCARCHDHKYDPISQKDFYQMFAFFNNVPEKGKDGDTAPQPNMDIYVGGTAEEHAVLKENISAIKKDRKFLVENSETSFSEWLETEKIKSTQFLDSLNEIPPPSLHIPFDSLEKRTTSDLREPDRDVALNDKSKKYEFLEESMFGSSLKIGASTFARVSNPHQGGYQSSQAFSSLITLRTPKEFAGSEGPILSYLEAESIHGYRLLLEETDDSKFYRLSFQITNDTGDGNGIEVVSDAVIPKDEWSRIGLVWEGGNSAAGLKLYLNGRLLETNTLLDTLEDEIKISRHLIIGARNIADAQEKLRDATFKGGSIDDLQYYDKALSSDHVQILSQTNPRHLMLANLNTTSRAALHQLWLRNTPKFKSLAKKQKDYEAELDTFEKAHITKVSIMKEMDTPRDTYLLSRGAYDQPDDSEELDPAVPAALPPIEASLPRDRLGLARWLVSPKNPLTARVAVNRYWQMYFGTGLVKTPEDFGSQGAIPSHPKLLDWLASEFMASGWNIKAMQKRIVMSATYRQSSRVSKSLLEKDPENRLLARGPRFRLYGQALRDQALAISGLMSKQRGGPPVMPYQPEGLWDELDAKGYKYIEGSGEDLYRRSMYTFWRRTVPPPSMMNFDNASREVCSVRLSSTNTPLQALNLMNDPQFVEAARVLAQRMIHEGGPSLSDQITFGHRIVLSRPPQSQTLEILRASYTDHLERYTQEPKNAQALVSIGASKPDENIKSPQLAAMTMVANVLLNLDETVTKQ